MATTSKYDISSCSPDGPAYSNGQRGSYGAAFMERSGSFREVSENRFLSSLSSMPKSGGDSRNLFQSLVSDLKPVVDQKFPKAVEMKRTITSALGLSSEESSVASGAKGLTPSSAEEVKRIKSNILEGSIKARDRAKAFGEAASRIDRCAHTTSKKRSRVDGASAERSNALLVGPSAPKGGYQSLLSSNSSEPASQRLEERAKVAVPNRRIRSSMAEGRMDARGTSITRPTVLGDRDKDAYKTSNGCTTIPEEKARPLSSTVDGWEKPNMKKKRSVLKTDVSVSTAVAKTLDGERDPRRGIQQKLFSDHRPRINNVIHGSRTGLTGTGGLDTSSQHSMTRPPPRSDQENASAFGDRKDGRLVTLDKDGCCQRTANKLNGREDSSAASPTSKLNPSARGPRSNSGSLSKAAQNIHRALANSDDTEFPQSIEKASGINGSTNRKRGTSTRSASPPVQWGEQRPQKISRVARRSNMSLFISSSDEYQASDVIESISNEDGLGVTKRLSSNASQQLKGEHAPASGLSESDDSGILESKSNSKIKKCSEIEEKGSQSIQKAAVVVSHPKKTKLAVDEHLSDGIRRQGRSGRGLIPTRPNISSGFEKVEYTTTTKQMRMTRALEKLESKQGRPLTKKLSERRAYTRPRHSMINSSLDITGDSYNDHEELLAAANAAIWTMNACTGSFWSQMEPIFSFISEDDVAFLKQEISSNACAEYSDIRGEDGRNDGLRYASPLSTPSLPNKEDVSAFSSGISCGHCAADILCNDQGKDNGAFSEQLQGIGSQTGFSVCQALLSAIIDDDDMENVYFDTNKGEERSHDYAFCRWSEFKEELGTKGVDSKFWTHSQSIEGSATTGYSIQKDGYHSHPNILDPILGSHNGSVELTRDSHLELILNDILPSQSMRSSTGCTEVQYGDMSIDIRILLELSEIGLYPEPVPDLAQSDDEDITVSVQALEGKLSQQVMEKKGMLMQLEKVVMEAKESQERELERCAMDKLVGTAYEKYMAFRGPNASVSKTVNKSIRHATQAFVKRTLARCRKFEQTGISCFNEPVFKDIFCSIPNQRIDAECRQLANNSKLTDVSACATSSYDNACTKEEPWSHKVKKRELLLDDVVAVASGGLRTPSGTITAFTSNAKGKRSERDRDSKGIGRDAGHRGSTVKVGRQPTPNPKGERKNKSKLKQKTTNLSASVSSFVGRAAEEGIVLASTPNSQGGNGKARDGSSLPSNSGGEGLPNDAEPIDFSGLQLPEGDVGDFGGQGQDLCSWLDAVDEDALLDQDFMGLEIPMDDLSELNMMI